MRKLLTIAIIIVCTVFLFSCKKTDDTNTNNDADNAPLIPASTGWEKVGSVKYSYTTVGFANQNSMEPVEIEKAGNQLHILYSENYRLTGVVGRQFFKSKLNIGANNISENTQISLPSGTDERYGLFYQYLIPGAFEAMATRFGKNGSEGTVLSVVNESGQTIGGHFIGHPGRSVSVYSNGDVMSGTIDYSSYAEMDFFNKETRGWTFIKGTSHDTTILINYTPFRMPDGSLNAFNITAKEKFGPKNKVYLSIANPVVNPVGQEPLYKSQFLMRIPEMEVDFYGTPYPAIVCSAVNNDVFTVVIAASEQDIQYPGKLYAYQWKNGQTAFTKLYSDVSIPTTEEFQNKLKTRNVQCTQDGTVYFWDPSLDGQSGELTLIDASGVHAKGFVNFNNAPVLLGAVKYLDGAYYAAVYPFTDQFDAKHNLRMDIVKLK